jgi:SNF2 family DNA or RNA helicase
MKLKHVSLNGDQKNKTIWREFQASKDIQVIVVQYQSGCSGIDLYESSHTIYFEPPLSSTILEQSRDRTHRIGVKNHCNYYFLITKGTMEQKIYERLVGYQDFTIKYLKEMYEKEM